MLVVPVLLTMLLGVVVVQVKLVRSLARVITPEVLVVMEFQVP
jgi:hypothetical protein